ncbi:MAG: hypothetical protein KGL39_13755 [Patescibacteria group bacterium]|nr:hypothetical protein [Patescibacteria group bacterium]
MKIISVDWDYFVKEDARLDWGHSENGFFLNQAWALRRMDFHGAIGSGETPKVTDLTKLVPFLGNEKLVGVMGFVGQVKMVAVAESHLAILQLLDGKRGPHEIYNVDAHHDLGYNDDPGKDRSRVNCGSWGKYLHNLGKVKSWTQCYPTWRMESAEDFPKLPNTSQVFSDDPVLNMPRGFVGKVDALFICRSGCWVPPEYDKRFTALCESLTVKPLPERSVNTGELKPGDKIEVVGLDGK